MTRGNTDNKEEVVAVAIDRDKGSQYALKWTIDHLLARGQSLTLVHVNQRLPSIHKPMGNHDHHHHDRHHHDHDHHVDDEVSRAYQQQLQSQAKELFLPYRCFCTRKNIKCFEVVLEDMDIPKALIDYVSANTVEILVLGAASRGGLVRRFKNIDVPSSVSKGAPNFCTVYVIAKGKISSIRSATCSLPTKVSSVDHTQNHGNHISDQVGASPMHNHHHRGERTAQPPQSPYRNKIMSPFTRHNRDSMNKPYEPYMPDTDISFVSSGRPSVDRLFPSFYENLESGLTTPRLSAGSDHDFGTFGSSLSGNKQFDMLHSQFDQYSSSSSESGKLSSSSSSQNIDEVEAEMKRLKLELKQTMDMYSSACRAALTAKQKARELHLWKVEEEHRLEEARLAEEAALAVAEKEKSRCKAALEAAEAATRLAEQEAHKRMSAEMKALKETEGKQKAIIALTHSDIRYRKYSIQEIEAATDNFSEYRKIGEGGYGPVYGCELDHTPVAIKVLRPDAAQGQSQFQQEVEVLSTIRHPNMVLLLGACPEYGCLVYEYMANGSLEDRLFCRGNTPYLPWQLRFRIAAEIGTGLLFLHHSKPEPLVHRDLKPANILLDRNYVSKISDVGLARLVPPSVADTVTQYRMTSTAGTFCYIDPEYQQTGMLGIKSDVYSLGVMLLQIITAKPPMGLTHHVERAIKDGTFDEVLDPAVPDWPLEEALKFAKQALQCTEMRRKDRPDLEVVLTELNRLRALAEDNMYAGLIMSGGAANSPRQRHTSTLQDMIRDSEQLQCRYETPKSRLSTYHFS